MKFFLRTLILASMLFSAMATDAQTRDFTFNNSAQREGLTVEQNTRSNLTMRHALKQLQIVNITDNGYRGDVVQGGTGISLPANAGEPNLPAFSRFVAVPNGATAHIEMGYRSMTTIADVDLLPAAPIKFDTDDSPDTYEKNLSIYNKNAFFPEQPVTVSAPFSLRGVQTVAVTVVPYQYNPVTKELRVYDDLQFDVRFDGGNGEFGETRLRSPYWDPILMQNLANYNQLPVIDYEARMQEWVNNRPEGCEYLIVIPNNEDFRQYANQLRDYRIQQGILTEVKSLSDMGCATTDQMKAYFHNAYNTWDIPPVAVLLLGDHNTNMSVGIPAEYTYHSQNYGNCITDNGYADVTGDLLPEMAFSRLVAANVNEAQMMVSKQLEYEYTNPNMDASSYEHPITALGWQTERWFQICSEVVGGYWRNQGKDPVRINAIYSGYPSNQWSSNQNTYMVVNYFGPNGVGYIPATPSELGGWTGGTGGQVVQAVNNGCMLLQHRDHGYYQGWGEPDFSSSHVTQMNNVGKMTFVNTINCQTGTFDHNPECLIEAFMRRTSSGQNAGAVGCIGPTQTSYSFVNDAYAWGMYDQYDPQFMPDYGPYANYEGNWRPAFGNVAGKYFLAQSNWPYNANNKAITYKMFTAHCDAFLTLYTQVPTTMNVSHPSQITATTTSINVSAPQGAIIALTRNNNILAVATATGSSQSITFPAQPSNSNITIVATKQDRLRYVGTIHVISEPTLTLTEVSVNDGNNGQLEYGEQASFNMVIKNTGDQASSQATATLTTRTTDYVTINQNTASIPALSPNQTTNLDNVFGITVADNVPNETRLDFTLTMVGGGHTWTSDFHFNAYAPDLKIYDEISINDAGSNRGNGNGRLDPGETAAITFNYKNNGGSAANDVTATLTTPMEQYITISSPTVTTPIVDVNQSVEVTYLVTVAATMPKGEAALFTLEVVSGAYSHSNSYSHRVGLDIEGFEQGLETFGWENDPDHPWTIVDTEPYSGNFCLQSGTIGHNATTTLAMHFKVENETDEIRFYRRTDCEANDYLKFYIDGVMQQQWGGSSTWREVIIPVTQGEHTFSWTYEKNASGTSGADHVWIDEILFPVPHIDFACNAGADQNICQVAAHLEANVIGYASLLWTTDGDGNFDHDDILNPIYTPGEQDLVNKVVTLTLTATNEEGETLSDNVTINFHAPASIEMEERGEICEGESILLAATVYEAENISWTTNGDGNFDDLVSIETHYIPGEQDIANGSVTLTLTAMSPFGCGDAVQEFNLVIHPLQHSEFEATSCGSYNWNGIEYNEEGDYEQVLQSIHGCDSTVVMHLHFIDNYNVEAEETDCGTYVWGGETFTESGVYEHTFTSMYGCDSIVVMHLTIYDHSETDFTAEACESYLWDPQGHEIIYTDHESMIYDMSGSYHRTYISIYGCDSIVTMHLMIENVPILEALSGDNEVDVRLTPVSTYTAEITNAVAEYFWSLEPQEAGMLTADYKTATVTWSETYKGEATLTVKAENECGAMELSKTVNVKNTTDVNEYGLEAKIYPNPTNSLVTIEAQSLQRLTVVNALGQTVYDHEVEGNTAQIEMAQFGTGTYLIRIQTGNGVAMKRVNVIR
ncbi:MAG: T9SS type A sorting domain-containing protein [Bacteroidales bacterium]|nr:T9SS type A sorting domain-containing protein [Bacteroidales bacterium]